MMQSVSRGANRFHNRARSITGKQSSQITITAPAVPNQVEPARRYGVGANIVNDATIISPTDPNICNPEALFIAGLNVRLEVKVNGTVVDSGTSCVAGLGGQNTIELAWSAPSVSDVTDVEVVYEARGAANDELLDRVSRTVTITQTAPEPGDPDDPRGCNSLTDIFTQPGCSFSDVVPINAAVAGGAILLFLIVLISVLAP